MHAPPHLVRSPTEVGQVVSQWKESRLRVGLVPTMGALHAGHVSLVQCSLQECQATVVTVFVNPAQFGPGDDFQRYPRQLDRDLEILGDLGNLTVFAPDSRAMYGHDHSTFIQPPSVAAPLEGILRPGHFRGVSTIVVKLFHLLAADVAYFGHKDYQQARVIQTVVDELNIPIQVRVCPTVREPDGLAMSSRNTYLSPAERAQAVGLFRALQMARQHFRQGQVNPQQLERTMLTVLQQHGITNIDYAAMVDGRTLQPVASVDCRCVALVAARVGSTRLIDNIRLDEGE